MARYTKQEREKALAYLHTALQPGDTVYTVLRHVSRSGMMRRIDLYKMTEDGPQFLTGWAATALGESWDRDGGGIKVGGCGMDMGFHLVYNLSYVLFPEGFDCIGDKEGNRCPACDHSNGDRNYKPHRHGDGGYALRHRWI